MITTWSGFSSEEHYLTDYFKMSLLGEEPFELLLAMQPATGSNDGCLVVEIPAERASFLIEKHRTKGPESLAAEIRKKLANLRDRRQHEDLAKGEDWW